MEKGRRVVAECDGGDLGEYVEQDVVVRVGEVVAEGEGVGGVQDVGAGVLEGGDCLGLSGSGLGWGR